jgi:hypothetical protein
MAVKIPTKLPASLSQPLSAVNQFSKDDIDFAYAIGGMGWLSAANPDRPVRRQTAPFRKQQLDVGGQAGEQSLENWWYRSQFTFHGGAGQLYNDPNTRNPQGGSESVETRYFKSCGVDVWTPGKVTLLPALIQVASAAVVDVFGYATPTNKNMVMWATGSTAYQRSADGGYSGSTAAPAGETIVSVCTNGSYAFIATSVGIYTGALPDGNGSMTWVKLWNTGSSKVRIAWVKQRLVGCIGTAVYELVGTGPTLPVDKKIFTHPNDQWIWTSVTEGGRAVYVAGYAGGRSSVFKFVPTETTGDLPQLSTGIVAAVVPEGENVHAVYGYLGTYIALGTSRGVRIGITDDNGDITYGPLIVETSQPVLCFTARDRFVYFGLTTAVDNKSGLGRIDLGYAFEGLRFAYAWDVFHANATSTVTGCALVGNSNNLAMGTSANGLFLNDGSGTKLAAGYLETSRARFSTLEPKLYKLLRVRGPLLEGSLGISITGMSGTPSPLITLPQGVVPSADLDIRNPSGPQEYISVRFVLNRHTTNLTLGAEFSSYQLKALPGTIRTRLIQLPLLCFDLESDPNGQRWGGTGTAITRLQEIEAIEATGDTILWQDFSNNTAEMVSIEQLEFIQSAPPQDASGWGGYLNVTLRTVK